MQLLAFKRHASAACMLACLHPHSRRYRTGLKQAPSSASKQTRLSCLKRAPLSPAPQAHDQLLGCLSALQLESVVYACQRHQQMLPDGSRAGFFIGACMSAWLWWFVSTPNRCCSTVVEGGSGGRRWAGVPWRHGICSPAPRLFTELTTVFLVLWCRRRRGRGQGPHGGR